MIIIIVTRWPPRRVNPQPYSAHTSHSSAVDRRNPGKAYGFRPKSIGTEFGRAVAPNLHIGWSGSEDPSSAHALSLSPQVSAGGRHAVNGKEAIL